MNARVPEKDSRNGIKACGLAIVEQDEILTKNGEFD